MAPTAPAPKKRTSLRAKLARAHAAAASPSVSTPRKVHRPESAVTDSFIDSKRDRRQIKRSAFLTQIKSKSSAHSSSSGIRKRRRPSKKLVTNLASLAAALPELADADDDKNADTHQPGKVRIKSLKIRPGALKRKEKLVRAETKNIGLSLAYLAKLKEPGEVRGQGQDCAAMAGGQQQPGPVEGSQSQDQGSAATVACMSSRWAALRAHISVTMEQNPAFLAKN